MDEPHGYQSHGSTGGRVGCALSALVGVPLLLLAFAAGVIGDCLPDYPCDKRLRWDLIAAAAAIAALVGLGARALINAFLRNRRRGD